MDTTYKYSEELCKVEKCIFLQIFLYIYILPQNFLKKVVDL